MATYKPTLNQVDQDQESQLGQLKKNNKKKTKSEGRCQRFLKYQLWFIKALI